MDPINTRDLDIDIEEARTKKKNVDMKMDSIKRLMREVELKEKDAEKAKQEVDDCTLEIMAEINDLILEQQRVKETNEKRAREVNARKESLATEMDKLSVYVSDVLFQVDGCVATTDEMYKSLEKRLTSAVKQKEAADKEKLHKEAALAYQRNQMEKLALESKKLEQQEMENIKLQELITNRGKIVNMLKGEMSYKCQDVNLLKYKVGDYEDESEISAVAEECARQVLPGMLPRRNCESYKTVKPLVDNPKFLQELAMDLLNVDEQARNGSTFLCAYQEQMEELNESQPHEQEEETFNLKVQKFLEDYGHLAVNMSQEVVSWKCKDENFMKEKVDDSKYENGIPAVEYDSMKIIQETIPMQDCENDKERVVASRNETRKNKIVKSRMNNLKIKEMKKWISGQITEAIADHEDVNFA